MKARIVRIGNPQSARVPMLDQSGREGGAELQADHGRIIRTAGRPYSGGAMASDGSHSVADWALFLVLIALAFLVPTPAHAQEQLCPSPVGSYAIGTVGGTAGSLIGVGAGVLLNICDDEKLGCVLHEARITTLMSTAGAFAGAYIAGRWNGTSPSLAGGVIGALAGAAVVTGLIRLLDEVEVLPDGREGALLVTYSVTQGLFTAAGSRLFASGWR